MNPTLAVALAVAAAAPAQHPPGMGAVLHVTAARAYLDVGAADGLAPGQVLRLLRGGALAATCAVEVVSPRQATCRTADGLPRRGDVFRVRPPAAAPPPRPLPRLVSAKELDREAAAVAAQPFAKVEARGARATQLEVAAAPRVEVAIAHATWGSTGYRPWSEERVDARIQAEAFAGLSLNADLGAVHWTVRPETARSVPSDRSQLYVWEAALATRDPDRPFTVALGRVLPWTIPGATPFDGVQLGLPLSRRRAEVGIFGGFVPSPATLALDPDRSTAGAYAFVELGSGGLVGREELRAAMARSPELGTRLEAEIRSLLLVARSVNVQGNLRVGVGGNHQAEGAIDLAQVDVSGRPHPRVQLSGLFRYAGLSVPDAPAPAIFPGAERRWDGAAGYELGPAVLSATGGLGRDLESGLERWYVGPEISFPFLFGAHGGATLGYAEERGWIGGRTAWAGATVRARSLWIAGRVTWTYDLRPGAAGDQALGLSASARADVARWLSLRASVLAGAGARGADLQDPGSGVAALAGLECRL